MIVNTLRSAARVAALVSALSFGLTISNVARAELGCLVAGALAGTVNGKAALPTNAACEVLAAAAEEAGKNLGEQLARESNLENIGGSGGRGGIGKTPDPTEPEFSKVDGEAPDTE